MTARGHLALALLLPVLLSGALLPGCGKGERAEARGKSGSAPEGAKGGERAFPVQVEKVSAAPVEFTVAAVGSVEAFEQIQLTARVSGVVEAVRFKEGDPVQQGQVLVEIDPSRYRLAVRAARAQLQREQAAQTEAQTGYQRREEVNAKSPGLVRGEELDTWRSRAESAAAQVTAARVALEQAQLNLDDALVKASVPGILQTRLVQTGQFVQPGTVLGTLVQRDPLLVRFEIPEGESARVLPGMEARFRVRDDGRLFLAKITHVSAAANVQSRMVAVTAQVEDDGQELLRPGAFAEVSVPVAQVEAPVIPQTAVRPSERGFLGFVVEEQRARERVLTLGMRTADGRVEVRAGLKAGELLVVRGAEALREGAPVRVEGERRPGQPDAEAGGSARGGRP